MNIVLPSVLLLFLMAGCDGRPGTGDPNVLKGYEGLYARISGPGKQDFYLQAKAFGEPALNADLLVRLPSVNQGWDCTADLLNRVCLRDDFDGKTLRHRNYRGCLWRTVEEDFDIDFSQYPIVKLTDRHNSLVSRYAWRGR